MKAARVLETIGGTTPADYFAHIPTVTFKGPDTDDELADRFYDKNRIVRQRAFHLAVLQGSHNPFFVQFEELVATALRMSCRDIDHRSAATVTLFEHCAVAEAIGNGDQLRARRAMEVIIVPVLRSSADT
jgi:DNA-binding FadR family transcriptional regulator